MSTLTMKQVPIGMTTKPWFKQRWPWILIALPATTIVASMITIWLAVTSSDGLVVGEYYKEGLGINQRLASERNASFLKVKANIKINNGKLLLDLSSIKEEPYDKLVLQFLHPTRDHFDQVLLLTYNPTNQLYESSVTLKPGVNWHIQLMPEDKSWRVSSRNDLTNTINNAGGIVLSAE